MKYLALLLLLTGCSTSNLVWEKKCFRTLTAPYEKCYEVTK